MVDGWFKFTLADFEANNQTLHNSVVLYQDKKE